MIPRRTRTNLPIHEWRCVNMPPPHDPWQCAEWQGIEVIHRPLKLATGYWVPDHNLIVLRSGMRRVVERSVLGHELAHAALGHEGSSPRNELQADRLAAHFMVDPGVFAEAVRFCSSLSEVAAECDVSLKLARAFAERAGLSSLQAVELVA